MKSNSNSNGGADGIGSSTDEIVINLALMDMRSFLRQYKWSVDKYSATIDRIGIDKLKDIVKGVSRTAKRDVNIPEEVLKSLKSVVRERAIDLCILQDAQGCKYVRDDATC